jgi:uncharacterized protein (TIGR00661 family)
MARIVYGVSGEGSGHSSRAYAMGEHLEARGHDLRMVSYDRGLRNLRDRFNVFETAGLHIASRDNKVSVPRTITENLAKSPRMFAKMRELRRTLFVEFQPDAVITDFEPMTAYLAWLRKVPLISLDNQHRIRYMDYPCPPGLDRDRRTTELVIKLLVPRPDVSLTTTFYYDKPKNDHTFLFPPILRDEVRTVTPSRGEHILVYLSFGFDSFLDRLRGYTGERFIVYGYDRDETDRNFTFRKFSREGFLHDMATSKAVMATAGFTTLTEGLYYRKPYLALPMKGQFEQQLNGFLVEQLGYGMNAPEGDAESIRRFLELLPGFEAKLESYRAEDNSAIEDKLDELLADDCTELKRYAKRA